MQNQATQLQVVTLRTQNIVCAGIGLVVLMLALRPCGVAAAEPRAAKKRSHHPAAKGTAPAGAALAADPFAPLGEQLQGELGRQGIPVAITYDEKGITARSADGARGKVIYSGPVKLAFVDHKAQLIWAVLPGKSGARLAAFDLTTIGTVAIPVLENLPPDLGFAVSYLEDKQEALRVGVGTAEYDGEIVLQFGQGKPKVVYTAGIYDRIYEREEELVTAARKVTFAKAGRSLTDAIPTRAKGRTHWLAQPAAAPRVAAVPRGGCDDAEECGIATAIPLTPYLLVAVSHGCGDGCHIDYNFYDPRAKAFFVPQQPRKRSQRPISNVEVPATGWISADGKWFASQDALYRLDAGQTVGSIHVGGWLTGQAPLR